MNKIISNNFNVNYDEAVLFLFIYFMDFLGIIRVLNEFFYCNKIPFHLTPLSAIIYLSELNLLRELLLILKLSWMPSHIGYACALGE